MMKVLSDRSRYKHWQECLVASLLVMFVCSDVLAQEAAAIHAGPFDVTPTLNINVENNDNVFSEGAGNETSATLAQFVPSVTAIADDGVVRYSLGYQLENGRYSGVDNNNYTDHKLDAKMDWRLDIRHLIEFGATESRGHDERSVDRVTGLNAAELDKTKERELSADYTFGSEGSRGRLAIGFKTSSLRYTTNKQATNVLESDTDTVNASFSVGVGASSRAIIEIADSKNTFFTNAVNDRKDRNYLLGVDWGISDLLQGSVRIGQSNNNLVNDVGDTSSSVGEASIVWSPVEHSVFTLSANKTAENTENDVGSFVDRSVTSLGWTHQITDRLVTTMSLGRQRDDFINANRSDTLSDAQFQLKYNFKRWLDVGMGITRTKRSSTDSSFNYANNNIVLSINASL
jgi:polysaccharide biosynthesis protein VpsM